MAVEEEQHPKVISVSQRFALWPSDNSENRNTIIFKVELDRQVGTTAREECWALNLAAHYVKKTWG